MERNDLIKEKETEKGQNFKIYKSCFKKVFNLQTRTNLNENRSINFKLSFIIIVMTNDI